MRLPALLILLLLAGCGGREPAAPSPDAVRERIFAELDELAAEGFHVKTGSIDGGRVRIELITERDDHGQYFRERYGPVDTEVIATELESIERTAARGYRADGPSLTLFYDTGGGARLERVDVEEGADRVDVAIVQRVPNGPRTLELAIVEETVQLERPLGDRAVVDAATGRRVRPCERPPCDDVPPSGPRRKRR
jgi:hypothetical protein